VGQSIVNKLLSRIEKNPKTECWDYTRYKDKDGYGSLRYKGQMIRTHRLSYLLFIGKYDNKLLICHHCDNPSCINPKHLFIGTVRDNTLDMISKNRHARASANHEGEKNPNAKLSLVNIEDIRRRYGFGDITQKQLALQYGVTDVLISKIVRGILWQSKL